MPVLIFKLFGIMGTIKRLALSAFQWVTASTTRVLIALLSLSLIGNVWLWRSREGVKQSLTTARAELVSQRYKFEQASEEARAAAIAQVKAVEARSAQLAKESRAHETDLRNRLGALAAAHADRMRFDKVCGRAPTAPAQDHPAPGDNGPGADAVILERRDYDTLIDNTARLKAAHDWATGLIEEGLAVKPVTAADIPEVGF